MIKIGSKTNEKRLKGGKVVGQIKKIGRIAKKVVSLFYYDRTY